MGVLEQRILPYARHEVTEEDIAAVTEVLRTGALTRGEKIEELEEALCRKVGCHHAVCVSSGTSALLAAYAAIGIGPGKTLFTTPITFVATAGVAKFLGADIKFVDVNPWTGRLEEGGVPFGPGDPVYGTSVWLAGEVAEYPAVVPHVHVIDACQALGHPHLGLALKKTAISACLSFHPAKQVAAGEGGAILTNDPQVADFCRAFRDNGRISTWRVRFPGLNLWMDEMSAALALSQLSRLDENVEKRRVLAADYEAKLKALEYIGLVKHSPSSARALFQIRVPFYRDRVRDYLGKEGIQTQIHFKSLAAMPIFQARANFPGADSFSTQALSLPLFPSMTEEDVDRVVAALETAIWEAKRS